MVKFEVPCDKISFLLNTRVLFDIKWILKFVVYLIFVLVQIYNIYNLILADNDPPKLKWSMMKEIC